MSLKQSIVVVNEYTVKNKQGGGTRGGSPGNYVLRYMAREGATETDTPVTLNNEDYILRYMARKDAVETLDDEKEIRRKASRAGRLGGIAFGNRGLSLSHTDLIESSKKIQSAFEDQNKTVMKTVISFDEEYLRDNGIIPEDFVFENRGDYRGNIDQMKLRYAIMSGLEYLGHDYDDLQYVGVIQVDTAHVHCHLAMVDMGKGIIMDDGTQKGKITAASIGKLRRGIDMALDESKEVQYMAANVGIDKRNMQTVMKRYTHEQVILYGAPQRILSVLPEDERLWRASTNRKEMEKANKICRDYVERLFAKPDSGISEAMQSIYDYARIRQEREGFTDEYRVRLERKGRENLVQGCMNSVYTTLKQIPEDRRNVSTPFLNMASTPVVSPSFNGDIQDFVYRSTAYHSRLEKHTKETKKYTEYIRSYEESEQAGTADPASRVLYEYFMIEREYQAKLASKYSQFLFFEEPTDDFVSEYLELSKKAAVLDSMRELQADVSAKKMKPQNAEAYGQERYGLYGGRYVVLDPPYFDQRVRKYERSYETDRGAFQAKLDARNLTVQEQADGQVVLVRQPTYKFDDVRGLDLHDLRGDFTENLEFSQSVRTAYLDMAERRIEAYEKACAYLDASGQERLKEVFDSQDIEAMRDVAEKIKAGNPVTPVNHPVMEIDDKYVMRLDRDMHQYIKTVVNNEATAIDYTEGMEEMEEREAVAV